MVDKIKLSSHDNPLKKSETTETPVTPVTTESKTPKTPKTTEVVSDYQLMWDMISALWTWIKNWRNDKRGNWDEKPEQNVSVGIASNVLQKERDAAIENWKKKDTSIWSDINNSLSSGWWMVKDVENAANSRLINTSMWDFDTRFHKMDNLLDAYNQNKDAYDKALSEWNDLLADEYKANMDKLEEQIQAAPTEKKTWNQWYDSFMWKKLLKDPDEVINKLFRYFVDWAWSASLDKTNYWWALNPAVYTDKKINDMISNKLWLKWIKKDENWKYKINAETINAVKELAWEISASHTEAKQKDFWWFEDQVKEQNTIAELREEVIEKTLESIAPKNITIYDTEWNPVKFSKAQTVSVIKKIMETDDSWASLNNLLKVIYTFEKYSTSEDPAEQQAAMQKINQDNYKKAVNDLYMYMSQVKYIYDHMEETNMDIRAIENQYYKENWFKMFESEWANFYWGTMEDVAITSYDLLRTAKAKWELDWSRDLWDFMRYTWKYLMNSLWYSWWWAINAIQAWWNKATSEPLAWAVYYAYNNWVIDNDVTLKEAYENTAWVQWWMKSLDVINSELTNDDSWTNEMFNSIYALDDAWPDIVSNVIAAKYVNEAVEWILPSETKILQNMGWKFWWSSFVKANTYSSALDDLSTAWYFKVKLCELFTKWIMFNTIQWAMVQWEFVEDYNELDFAMDTVFSLFDVWDVLKSYKWFKPKLQEAFKNKIWQEVTKKTLNVSDVRWSELTEEQRYNLAEKFKQSTSEWLNEFERKTWLTKDELLERLQKVYEEWPKEELDRMLSQMTEVADDAYLKKFMAAWINNKSVLEKISSLKEEWNWLLWTLNYEWKDKALADSILWKIEFNVVETENGGKLYSYQWKEQLTAEERKFIDSLTLNDLQVNAFDNLPTKRFASNELSDIFWWYETLKWFWIEYNDTINFNWKNLSIKEYNKITAKQMKDEDNMLKKFINKDEIETFKRWEYDTYGEGYLYWDTEYRFINKIDKEAELKKRLEEYSKHRVEYKKQLQNNIDVDVHYDSKYSKVTSADALKWSNAVWWRKNLIWLTYDDAVKINPDLNKKWVKEFFYAVSNDKGLSIEEKNQILWSMNNKEKTSFTISSNPTHLYWSKVEQEYFMWSWYKYWKAWTFAIDWWRQWKWKYFIKRSIDWWDTLILDPERWSRLEFKLQSWTITPTKNTKWIITWLMWLNVSFTPSSWIKNRTFKYHKRNLVFKNFVDANWNVVENPIMKTLSKDARNIDKLSDILKSKPEFLSRSARELKEATEIKWRSEDIPLEWYDAACRIVWEKIPQTWFFDVQKMINEWKISSHYWALLLYMSKIMKIQEFDKVFKLTWESKLILDFKDFIFWEEWLIWLPWWSVDEWWYQWFRIETANKDWSVYQIIWKDESLYWHLSVSKDHKVYIREQWGERHHITEMVVSKKKTLESWWVEFSVNDVIDTQPDYNYFTNSETVDRIRQQWTFMQEQAEKNNKTWNDVEKRERRSSISNDIQNDNKDLLEWISFLKESEMSVWYLPDWTFKEFVSKDLSKLLIAPDFRKYDQKALWNHIRDYFIIQDDIASIPKEIKELKKQEALTTSEEWKLAIAKQIEEKKKRLNSAEKKYVLYKYKYDITTIPWVWTWVSIFPWKVWAEVKYDWWVLTFRIKDWSNRRYISMTTESDYRIVEWTWWKKYIVLEYDWWYLKFEQLRNDLIETQRDIWYRYPIFIELWEWWWRPVFEQTQRVSNINPLKMTNKEAWIKQRPSLTDDDALVIYNTYRNMFKLDDSWKTATEMVLAIADMARKDDYVNFLLESQKRDINNLSEEELLSLYKEWLSVRDSIKKKRASWDLLEEITDEEAMKAYIEVSWKWFTYPSSIIMDDLIKESTDNNIFNMMNIVFYINRWWIKNLPRSVYITMARKIQMLRYQAFIEKYNSWIFKKLYDFEDPLEYNKYLVRIRMEIKFINEPIQPENLKSEYYEAINNIKNISTIKSIAKKWWDELTYELQKINRAIDISRSISRIMNRELLDNWLDHIWWKIDKVTIKRIDPVSSKIKDMFDEWNISWEKLLDTISIFIDENKDIKIDDIISEISNSLTREDFIVFIDSILRASNNTLWSIHILEQAIIEWWSYEMTALNTLYQAWRQAWNNLWVIWLSNVKWLVEDLRIKSDSIDLKEFWIDVDNLKLREDFHPLVIDPEKIAYVYNKLWSLEDEFAEKMFLWIDREDSIKKYFFVRDIANYMDNFNKLAWINNLFTKEWDVFAEKITPEEFYSKITKEWYNPQEVWAMVDSKWYVTNIFIWTSRKVFVETYWQKTLYHNHPNWSFFSYWDIASANNQWIEEFWLILPWWVNIKFPNNDKFKKLWNDYRSKYNLIDPHTAVWAAYQISNEMKLRWQNRWYYAWNFDKIKPVKEWMFVESIWWQRWVFNESKLTDEQIKNLERTREEWDKSKVKSKSEKTSMTKKEDIIEKPKDLAVDDNLINNKWWANWDSWREWNVLFPNNKVWNSTYIWLFNNQLLMNWATEDTIRKYYYHPLQFVQTREWANTILQSLMSWIEIPPQIIDALEKVYWTKFRWLKMKDAFNKYASILQDRWWTQIAVKQYNNAWWLSKVYVFPNNQVWNPWDMSMNNQMFGRWDSFSRNENNNYQVYWDLRKNKLEAKDSILYDKYLDIASDNWYHVSWMFEERSRANTSIYTWDEFNLLNSLYHTYNWSTTNFWIDSKWIDNRQMLPLWWAYVDWWQWRWMFNQIIDPKNSLIPTEVNWVPRFTREFEMLSKDTASEEQLINMQWIWNRLIKWRRHYDINQYYWTQLWVEKNWIKEVYNTLVYAPAWTVKKSVDDIKKFFNENPTFDKVILFWTDTEYNLEILNKLKWNDWEYIRTYDYWINDNIEITRRDVDTWIDWSKTKDKISKSIDNTQYLDCN